MSKLSSNSLICFQQNLILPPVPVNTVQHPIWIVIALISNLGKRVASFGDGPGLYKKRLLELSQVALYDAFDGAPYAENSTEGRCHFLDLSVPVYHLEDKYDWIVSTEGKIKLRINSNINCVLVSVFSYLFKNKTIEDKSESEALWSTLSFN